MSKNTLLLFLVLVLTCPHYINAQFLLDCVENIQVDNISVTQDFTAKSSDSLSTRAQHTNNSIVNYTAPYVLRLENGFKIEPGTEASIQVLSCTVTCPCDGVPCASNYTCISGVCTANSSLTYGDCTVNNDTSSTLGDCNQTLAITPTFSMTLTATDRIITSNNIPNHMVGLFGGGPGSLNPNAITAQSSSYTITLNPSTAASKTELLGTSGPPNQQGPQYSFGILLNGIELDPIAAEPWPHQGPMHPSVDWAWNLDALGLGINLGLDCNSAHVQPTGKYHYHGKPELYLQGLSIGNNSMTLIGYAADGFPIYYKYAYEDANDSTTTVIEMQSSFRLKQCERPGDGSTAPCGNYDGTYSNDWEYIEASGTLDECNGRTGVTPEYPGGTYYYIITDKYPSIPRCFKGTPSNDFDI